MDGADFSTLTRLTASEARERLVARHAGEVGEGFESIFLHMLLEPLESLGESFFGGGSGGRIFGGLYRQHVAEAMAAVKPLGLAKLIEKSISPPEEPSSTAEPERATPPGEESAPWNRRRALESYGEDAR